MRRKDREITDIDKIEVQRQCSYQGYLRRMLACVVRLLQSVLYFIGVIRCKTDKDQDAYIADNHSECSALQKEVYNRCNNQSDQAHEAQTAYIAQISFRNDTYQCHCGESACRDEEYTRYAARCVRQKDSR